jgi:hypothetical protein
MSINNLIIGIKSLSWLFGKDISSIITHYQATPEAISSQAASIPCQDL